MIKQYFKNGNVNIKLDINSDLYENTEKDVVTLYDLYEECYFYAAGYDCWGTAYYIWIYDYYSNMLYLLDDKKAKQFFDGKTVKLIGEKPDNDVYDYLNFEYGFTVE